MKKYISNNRIARISTQEGETKWPALRAPGSRRRAGGDLVLHPTVSESATPFWSNLIYTIV
jgi:hypothetical protein